MQAGSRQNPAIELWRAQLVRTILRVMFFAGAIVAVPSVGYAFATQQHAIVVIDLVALLAVGVLTFARDLHYRTRAIGLLATVYGLGVGLIMTVGLVSQIYLLAVPILAALLLGLRASIVALVINAVTLLVAGLGGGFDRQLQVLGIDAPFEWVVITLNFLFVNGMLAISCAVLLRRLDRSLREELAASHSLAAERAELQEANDELTRQISQRQRAQAQATRLEVAVTKARDVIMIGDEQGKITFANEAAQDLRSSLGRPGPWSSLDELATDDQHDAQVRAPLMAGRASAFWATFAREDASNLEFSARLTPVQDRAGDLEAFVLVLRDVTDERRVESRLRHAEKLEALGTLASGTAHDFNNVLGSILAVAESAKTRTDDAHLQEDLAAIVGACDRARDVVRQLVSFGEPPSSGRVPVRLRSVVETALPLLRAALPTHIFLDVDLRSEQHLLARPAELEQVLTNLVTNAAHAVTDAADTAIRVDVSDRLPSARNNLTARTGTNGAARGAEVVLSVSDRGRGIDPQDLQRIFDPFFTTKGVEGSGLGLASVHAIVNSLGGHIDVETAVGQGTTFHVKLPALDRSISQPPTPNQAPQLTTQRILLAEDEDLIRRLAAQALSQGGYEVTAAADGKEALQRFEADPNGFDLLITDMVMPELDGAGLIERIHAIRPELAVILCSGNAEGSETGTSTSPARQAFLPKPYSVSALATEVRTILGPPAA